MKRLPYMDNNPVTDSYDFKSIMGNIGRMDMISTQVFKDVIDELQNEIDNRDVPLTLDLDALFPNLDESLDKIAIRENAHIDNQERNHGK